jgi:hypothetical protein
MSDNYWTHPRPDGKWGSKKEGASRDSRTFNTQKESWDYSRGHARQTGSEAILQNRQGQIRERNTYGKDPYPPKG